jgi:hypothetical protein
MTYISVPDFKHGLNRLRPQVAGLPGELWNAVNCVISRGGDIEAAKKFVPEYVLPTGATFGLGDVNGVAYVFGTASSPAGMPPDLVYQQLTYSGGANLVKVHDARSFSGKMYVIAEFDDGNILHFYDGAQVTEWNGVADGQWGYTTVAKRLAQKINARSDVSASAAGNRVIVTADVSGTSFTIATSTIDNANVASSAPTAVIAHLQANVAPVAEVRAMATVTITGGTSSPGVNSVGQIAVGANSLLAAPVDWVLSNDATANAVALAITSAAVAGYSASAVGNVITLLEAPGVGATINGTSPSVTTGGDVTATHTAFAGGVTSVAAVTQIEQVTISATTADTLDTWEVTVNGALYLTNGRGSATGTLIHVVFRRVWIPVGTILNYCKLSDPTVWTTTAGVPATDPGFFDTSVDSEGSDDIVSLTEHNDGTALFSNTDIRIYTLDTDATNIKLFQTCENTGSIAAKIPLQYGSVEVYYLAMTGPAAIRSRLGSNFVVTSDFASAITPYLQDFVAEIGTSVALEGAAAIDPVGGRYLIALANKIFVLSAFVDSGVSAWTEIDLAFTVEQFLRIGSSIMARSGDTIYVYGGLTGDVYPAPGESVIDIETPYLVAQDPAGKKDEGGFDMAGTGTWKVELRVDPNNPTKTAQVGTIAKITYPTGAIRVPVNTTHVAVHMTCASGGKATLSNLAVHYEMGEST